jgi:hypothetical protein
MRHLNRILPLALVLGLAFAAAGCGSKSEPGPTPAKSAAPVRKVAIPADSLSPYLVTAVTTAKSGAAMLQVKFELGARPEVGDPVDVDVVIVPAADNIDGISGTIQGDDGLEVVSGATMPQAEKPVYGTPIHHSLKVRAKREGVFTLNAVMTIESGGQTLGPVYSMPIIAGNGLADSGVAAVPRPSQPKPAPTAAAQ